MMVLLLSLFVFASGDHGDHHSKSHRFGPEKAIVDVNKDKGFKLSKESQNLLKIITQKVKGEDFRIPAEAIVYIKDRKGYYSLREGYFKFHQWDEKPQLGDEIVIEGKELIAINDIFSTDKSEYGHSH